MDRRSKCMALEKQHVHDVYERTAHHFRDVRYRAWPRVRRFLSDQEPGSLVADVGCGSGKYLHINKDVFKVGCDHSVALVDIAHGRHHSVLVCDNLSLPYRDDAFDAVISIGVIHHLTSRERRVQALRELARVLRPGGKLMVYVWAMEQRHRQFEAQDVLVPWNFQSTFKHKRKKESSRLKNVKSDTFSDEEGGETTGDGGGHKKTGHLATPVTQCRGLRHHELGDGAKHRNQDCKQKRKTFHKQKELAQVNSSHSRDGGSSSCASSTSFSLHTKSLSIEDRRSIESGHSNQNSPSSQQKNVKRSNSLKNWVTNLFSGPQRDNPREFERIMLNPKSRRKLKDFEYKQLICQIVKEDIEMFNQQRPLLEHSMSAPDADIFAVREFPQSSQPELRKLQSLDSARQPNTLHCSVYTKNVQRNHLHGDQENTSQKTGTSPQLVEGATNGAHTLHNGNSDSRSNANGCALDRLDIGCLEEENRRVFNDCQTQGHPSLTAVTNGSQSCHNYLTAEFRDDSCLIADISNRNLDSSKLDNSLPNNTIHESSGLTLVPGCINEARNMKEVNFSSNSDDGDSKMQGSKSGIRTRLISKRCNSNGVDLSDSREGAPTDSSPDSPSYESEPSSHDHEGSSLSSPDEEVSGQKGGQQEDALPGLLEEVEGIQYPSLSDSDADEWAKVTVKAIRMMQTEVLRKVGTSVESVTSQQAVLGSSADLQDVDDEDLHSPQWFNSEVSVATKSRFMHHGSCESSSLSSDPYTESEGDESGQGLDNGHAFTERAPSQAETSVQHRRDIVTTVEKRLQCTNAKSDLWNRRRILRRFQSLSENGNTTDVTASSPQRHATDNKQPLKAHSQDSSGTGGVTMPNSKLSDVPTMTNENGQHTIKTVPKEPQVECLPKEQPPSEEGLTAPPEGTTETTYHRYYHVFREGELVSLINNHVEHLHLLDAYYDNANWCVVAEKVRVWRI